MKRAALLAAMLLLASCGGGPSPTPRPACPTDAPTSVSAQATLVDATLATVTVSGAVSGEFAIELFGDEAPLATASFVALARCGYFDGIKFHRVVAGFVIQAGDPQTKAHDGDFDGIGTGGPGYSFEIEPPADGLVYDRYSVSMANAGITNGSQFFVALEDLDQALRSAGVFTIFGSVVSGTDVVDAIAEVPVGGPPINVPLTPVTIDRIVISGGETPTPSGG
jgi:peptidyl-prolyl cis-trans isomerase B (cyclophilin B)